LATVKVFLPTYNRSFTLKRSVASLLAQTFNDWECEVHNDSPADPFPEQYIRSLNDNRFKFILHSENLGGVATFNLMFDKTDCKYICLLEDDNWWEPEFLSTMTKQMDLHANCSIGYANYMVWKEEPNNSWKKVESTEAVLDGLVSLVPFSGEINAIGYNHSNCSFIVRNQDQLDGYKVPSNIRLDFIEHIHERAFKFPLLHVNRKLANFGVTIRSNRKSDRVGWYEHQLLLTDSFFTNFNITDKQINYLWNDARQYNVKAYFHLLYAGILYKSSRAILKMATINDWVYFIAYNLKHPTLISRCIYAKKTHKQLWDFLILNTAQRARESAMFDKG
jgi:glycosyltransferase involved in cell wall biosynthesis